jgi:type II secretory pathway component PulM
MDKWWQTLSERDRAIVYYAAIVAAFLLFYFIVMNPLSEKNAALMDSNAQTRELIDWMQKAKVQLVQLHQQSKNKSAANVSLLSAIEQSVKRNRLDAAAGEIKQLEKNRVQISFAKVEFQAVMRWLEDVQITSASKIDKVSIQKTDKPGVVHLELTLER